MPRRPNNRGGHQAAQSRDKHRDEQQDLSSDPDCPPPRFWDNLSHIPLCKRALRELDRRNDTNQSRQQSTETLRLSYRDIRQLEAGIKSRGLKRFSRIGGPDLSDLRGYTNSLTRVPSEDRGRRRSRRNMPGRGRTSASALGKRRRNAEDGSAEPGGEPRARGRGRGRSNRARGRPRGGGNAQKSVAAAHKSTTTSNKTGPHDPLFTQHLLDYNVLPLVHYWPDAQKPEPPDNMEEIETRLSFARTSEPAENFQRFKSQYEQVECEDDALNLLDILQGDRIALAQSQVIRQKKRLNNLEPLTDGSIKPGSPDRAYGARSNELEISIREELDGKIVPTRQKDFICPNFVVHVKSDKGDVGVARAQAAYDGALAARGMEYLWGFGNEPQSSHEIRISASDRGRNPGNIGTRSDRLTCHARIARTITCTWAVGVLTMYATHCEEPGSKSEPQLPKYVPSLIGSWVMTAKEGQFREGLAAYRNGLDWAKSQRDEVISRANERVRAENSYQHRYEEDDNEENGDPGPSSARRTPEAREHDEYEDNDEAEDQDEDGDRDSADEDIVHGSFDSQKTITRSMTRQQVNRQRS